MATDHPTEHNAIKDTLDDIIAENAGALPLTGGTVTGDLQVDRLIKAKGNAGQTAPAYGFTGDTEGLGIYGSTSSQWLRLTAGGLWRVQIGAEQVLIKPDLQVDGQTLAQNGTKSKPAYSFASDPDTGMLADATGGIELVGNGERLLYVGTGAGGDGAWIPAINARTTTNPANVRIDPTGGSLDRSVSSRAFMQEVEAVNFDATNSVYDLEPIWFRSTCDGDNIEHSHYGLAAEDCAAVDPRLAIMATDENGVETADGVNTNAVIALLVSAVKSQRETIASLTARVEALET